MLERRITYWNFHDSVIFAEFDQCERPSVELFTGEARRQAAMKKSVLNLFRRLHKAFDSIVLELITDAPGDFGYSIRRRYWKSRLLYLGQNVQIEVGVHIQDPAYVSIGDHCWIDRHVSILAGPDRSSREKVALTNALYRGAPSVVHIGRNVHVGPFSIISGISSGVYISDDCGFSAFCKVYAFTSHYRSPRAPGNRSIHFGPRVPHVRQVIVEGPIFLGENTGIALGVTVLPGVAIRENSFVRINTVVSAGEYAPNSVLQGDPAERVGDRFSS